MPSQLRSVAVALVVRTVDQWFVGPQEVTGKISSPPNRGQLIRVLQLQLGHPYEDSNLQSAPLNFY